MKSLALVFTVAILCSLAYADYTVDNESIVVGYYSGGWAAERTQIENTLDDLGFSLVELLSPCPTNWKLSPKDAWNWVNEEMVKTYPLGVIKDATGYEDKK